MKEHFSTALNRDFGMLASLVRRAVELDVCATAPQLLGAPLRGLYSVCDTVVKSASRLCRRIRINHSSHISRGVGALMGKANADV